MWPQLIIWDDDQISWDADLGPSEALSHKWIQPATKGLNKKRPKLVFSGPIFQKYHIGPICRTICKKLTFSLFCSPYNTSKVICKLGNDDLFLKVRSKIFFWLMEGYKKSCNFPIGGSGPKIKKGQLFQK